MYRWEDTFSKWVKQVYRDTSLREDRHLCLLLPFPGPIGVPYLLCQWYEWPQLGFIATLSVYTCPATEKGNLIIKDDQLKSWSEERVKIYQIIAYGWLPSTFSNPKQHCPYISIKEILLLSRKERPKHKKTKKKKKALVISRF